MKKYLLFVATISVMTLGLISCEKKEEVSYSIVGTWELVSEEMLEYVNGELVNKYFDDEGGIWVSFNNDGTFSAKEDYGDEVYEDFGNYKYENGKLVLLGDGEDSTYDVTFITETKMTLEGSYSYSDSGNTYKDVTRLTYQKIK